MPLVCDASSDFLSRPLDLDRYGLIYAGAQKNIGPAGVTVVLVRDDFLQQRKANLPTLLDYGTHAAKLFHTPPVFAVYAVGKVLAWLEDQGGIPAIARVNQEKADLLYGCIDAGDFYTGSARKQDRSMMNVCFRLPTEALEAQFIAQAAEADDRFALAHLYRGWLSPSAKREEHLRQATANAATDAERHMIDPRWINCVRLAEDGAVRIADLYSTDTSNCFYVDVRDTLGVVGSLYLSNRQLPQNAFPFPGRSFHVRPEPALSPLVRRPFCPIDRFRTDV